MDILEELCENNNGLYYRFMWISRRPPNAVKPRIFTRRSLFSHTEFQWRYTLFLLMAVTCGGISAGGSAYYFLNQNYQIFIGLAYGIAPDLVEHLEKEQVWINIFLLSTFTAIIIFCIFLGLRLTARIIYPLLALEKHIKALTRGQWFIPELNIRNTDEFHELINSYNYFYKSVQIKTRQDLNLLEQLKKENISAELKEQVDHLIQRQRSLLKEDFPKVASDGDALAAKAHDSSLAS